MDRFARVPAWNEGQSKQPVILAISDHVKFNIDDPDDMNVLAGDLEYAKDAKFAQRIESALQNYPDALGYLQANSPYMRSRMRDNLAGATVRNLYTAVEPYRRQAPANTIGVWRFHSTPSDYQSHGYQESGGSYNRLRAWSKNPDAAGEHMYHSNRNSFGISYARNLGKIVSETSNVGVDNHLTKIIHGDSSGNGAAKYLSYTHIPNDQLRYPENTPLPRADLSHRPYPMAKIEGLSFVRDRAISEGEVLHVPPPFSRGITEKPLAVFKNPFAARGTAEIRKLPDRYLDRYLTPPSAVQPRTYDAPEAKPYYGSVSQPKYVYQPRVFNPAQAQRIYPARVYEVPQQTYYQFDLPGTFDANNTQPIYPTRVYEVPRQIRYEYELPRRQPNVSSQSLPNNYKSSSKNWKDKFKNMFTGL